MSLLILPTGSAPGHTVAMSEEALLRQDLLGYFKSLNENWIDMEKLSAQVTDGVVHLESNGIKWTSSALSGRHTIDNDCLAVVIAGKTDDEVLHRRTIREYLKITSVDVSESRLGLPIVPSDEYSLVLRHLWIHAAIFMRERKYKERISALMDRLPPSPLLA